MQTFAEFFTWCTANELSDDRAISQALSCTHQTVHNWRTGRSRGARGLPRHVYLQTLGFEARQTETPGGLSVASSIAAFDAWRAERGLESLEKTGIAFGMTRQAIHNWVRRERLPRWIELASLGYDVEPR